MGFYYDAVEMYMLKKDGWTLAFKSVETPCEIHTELRNGSNGHKELIIMSSNACSIGTNEPPTSEKWIYEFEDNEVKLVEKSP